VSDVHLGTPAGNPSCKVKDPSARLTRNPSLVTCEACQSRALAVIEKSSALLPLEQARKILAGCVRLDEAKEIRDKAEAIRAYLRQQRASGEAQNDAAEIKLRAERRLGELLEPEKEKRGGQSGRGRTLPDGVSRSQSSRWQDVARVPEEKFEAFIAETRAEGGEVTTTGLRREHVAKQKHEARIAKLGEIARGNKPLPVGQTASRYPVIYADPPWKHDKGTIDPSREIENQYPTMELEAICGLKVAELATDDAVLFLWVPNPLLPEGFAVLKAWGFTYKTNLAWDKEIVGTGYWVRGQHELLIVATRGNPPPPPPDARPSSVIRVRRSEVHSEKPEEAYARIEQMFPTLPKIELFAREVRPGFDRWGNQAPGVLEATG
jgi:N6-adenosine-specific RNA methylase IME4